jgi:hypothetical protein
MGDFPAIDRLTVPAPLVTYLLEAAKAEHSAIQAALRRSGG